MLRRSSRRSQAPIAEATEGLSSVEETTSTPKRNRASKKLKNDSTDTATESCDKDETEEHTENDTTLNTTEDLNVQKDLTSENNDQSMADEKDDILNDKCIEECDTKLPSELSSDKKTAEIVPEEPAVASDKSMSELTPEDISPKPMEGVVKSTSQDMEMSENTTNESLDAEVCEISELPTDIKANENFSKTTSGKPENSSSGSRLNETSPKAMEDVKISSEDFEISEISKDTLIDQEVCDISEVSSDCKTHDDIEMSKVVEQKAKDSSLESKLDGISPTATEEVINADEDIEMIDLSKDVVVVQEVSEISDDVVPNIKVTDKDSSMKSVVKVNLMNKNASENEILSSEQKGLESDGSKKGSNIDTDDKAEVNTDIVSGEGIKIECESNPSISLGDSEIGGEKGEVMETQEDLDKSDDLPGKKTHNTNSSPNRECDDEDNVVELIDDIANDVEEIPAIDSDDIGPLYKSDEKDLNGKEKAVSLNDDIEEIVIEDEESSIDCQDELEQRNKIEENKSKNENGLPDSKVCDESNNILPIDNDDGEKSEKMVSSTNDLDKDTMADEVKSLEKCTDNTNSAIDKVDIKEQNVIEIDDGSEKCQTEILHTEVDKNVEEGNNTKEQNDKVDILLEENDASKKTPVEELPDETNNKDGIQEESKAEEFCEELLIDNDETFEPEESESNADKKDDEQRSKNDDKDEGIEVVDLLESDDEEKDKSSYSGHKKDEYEGMYDDMDPNSKDQDEDADSLSNHESDVEGNLSKSKANDEDNNDDEITCLDDMMGNVESEKSKGKDTRKDKNDHRKKGSQETGGDGSNSDRRQRDNENDQTRTERNKSGSDSDNDSDIVLVSDDENEAPLERLATKSSDLRNKINRKRSSKTAQLVNERDSRESRNSNEKFNEANTERDKSAPSRSRSSSLEIVSVRAPARSTSRSRYRSRSRSRDRSRSQSRDGSRRKRRRKSNSVDRVSLLSNGRWMTGSRSRSHSWSRSRSRSPTNDRDRGKTGSNLMMSVKRKVESMYDKAFSELSHTNKGKGKSNSTGRMPAQESRSFRGENRSRVDNNIPKKTSTYTDKQIEDLSKSCQLIIRYLPDNYTEAQFFSLIADHGNVIKWDFDDQLHVGFVVYENFLTAKHARQALDGRYFGGDQIFVAFANSLNENWRNTYKQKNFSNKKSKWDAGKGNNNPRIQSRTTNQNFGSTGSGIFPQFSSVPGMNLPEPRNTVDAQAVQGGMGAWTNREARGEFDDRRPTQSRIASEPKYNPGLMFGRSAEEMRNFRRTEEEDNLKDSPFALTSPKKFDRSTLESSMQKLRRLRERESAMSSRQQGNVPQTFGGSDRSSGFGGRSMDNMGMVNRGQGQFRMDDVNTMAGRGMDNLRMNGRNNMDHFRMGARDMGDMRMGGRGMDSMPMDGRGNMNNLRMGERGMDSMNMGGRGMDNMNTGGRGMDNMNTGGRGMSNLNMDRRGMDSASMGGMDYMNMERRGMDSLNIERRGMDNMSMSDKGMDTMRLTAQRYDTMDDIVNLRRKLDQMERMRMGRQNMEMSERSMDRLDTMGMRGQGNMNVMGSRYQKEDMGDPRMNRMDMGRGPQFSSAGMFDRSQDSRMTDRMSGSVGRYMDDARRVMNNFGGGFQSRGASGMDSSSFDRSTMGSRGGMSEMDYMDRMNNTMERSGDVDPMMGRMGGMSGTFGNRNFGRF